MLHVYIQLSVNFATFECIIEANVIYLVCRSSDQESYSVEFIFDADVKCAVTVHFMATEDLSTGFAM